MSSFGTIADHVRIYDGNSYRRVHLISQLTGTMSHPSNFSSVDSEMLIVFDTDEGNTYKKGFKANIFFEEANTDNATNACTVLDPCNIDEGHCHYDGQCYGSLRCGQSNCPQNSDHGITNCCYDYCGQFLDMESGILNFLWPKGTLYEDMQECSWLIQVAEDHLISVEFIGDIRVSFRNLVVYDWSL